MLSADNSIVLMIDFQDKLVKATNAQNEAQNACKMLSAAKILNLPVIVSEQYPNGLGHTDCAISDLFDENVKLVDKTSFSLLKEPQMLSLLKSYGKKQVIIFGIETHICVLQTAIELLMNGFEVYLIKNASKSRSELEHIAGCEVMKNEGIKLLTLEIALFQLLETSKNPHFKDIQALIK